MLLAHLLAAGWMDAFLISSHHSSVIVALQTEAETLALALA
jgi:hypothetical protein